MSGRRPRVLVPIYEPLDGPLSALGTRRLEIGCGLAERCDVTFATEKPGPTAVRGLSVKPMETVRQFRGLLASHDFLYTLSIYPKHAHAIAWSGVGVILDLYAPVAFECLEAYPELPVDLLDRIHRHRVKWTMQQLRMASVLVVANARQADFWLGVANQLELLNATRIRQDPALAEMIIEIPIGVPPGSPEPGDRPLRRRLSLAGDDFVFLWSSKILAWQDPQTLLNAMQHLRTTKPRIKTVFLGVGDPVPAGKTAWLDAAALRTLEARQLADELGLAGTNVFFVDERIPYEQLGDYYRDCDAAVATYPDTLETRMCLGTRLADYVWAELPIAVSGGPLQHDFVEAQGVGFCTRPGDHVALATSMAKIEQTVLTTGWCRDAFAKAKQAHAWSGLTAPLANWCEKHVDRQRKPRAGLPELVNGARYVIEDRLIRGAISRR